MNSKVIVLADETGKSVVNVSENNADYGYIRVQQSRTMVDDSGFIQRKTLTALVPGLVEDLVAMNLSPNQHIDGKIIIEESLTPFNKKNPSRDLKIAGDTGVVCTLGGMPIYRRTKWSLNEASTDTTVEHDNVDELRAAYATQEKAKAVQPNEDFSIEG